MLKYICILGLLCFACMQSVFAQQEFDIIGLDDSVIEDNVRLHLKDVAIPTSSFNTDKYIEALSQKVETAVRAFSYYDAAISIEKQSNMADENTWLIQISLGEQTSVKNVVLLHDVEDVPVAARPKGLNDLIQQIQAWQGKPLNHSDYESLKAKLRAYSVLYGFFDFSFPLHKLIITPGKEGQASSATVHWIFYFGKRYKFGGIDYLEQKVGSDLVEKVKPFKQGDYFSQAKVSEFSMAMQSTGYFQNAIARANADKSTDFEVPIEVILTARPRDNYEFGVGVSTDSGPRLTLDWSRPWVNLSGHTIKANLLLSQPRKSAEIAYRIPTGNPLKDFIDIQLGFQQIDENQTESDQFSLAIQRQYGARLNGEWDIIGFMRYSQESFRQGIDEARQTTRLFLPGVTFSRLRKKGDLFVEWGDRQQLTLSGASQSLLSDIDFTKLLIRSKWIREYSKHRVIMRADLGAIASSDFEQVPASERFFAGGDQSIRGFGLNEVSDFRFETVDDEQKLELIGGRYLSVGSVEYAYKVHAKWRAAIFVDAGNASREFAKDLAYGVGFGAHYLSPIGNIRLYVARGESALEKSWGIHLIIGPGV
ncbi:autotransporter assembly complex protein TamA [Agaribacter flavus]|uniref:Translocation and assembly module subunit TamA n=1 Tax=Agaribacter flavus TaxID=1902781 RepID=A0ABV7FM07_9ALTE